jgi:hypothetical protein
MSRFAEESFDGLVPECLCSEKRIFVNRVRALARIWNPRCLLAFGSWSLLKLSCRFSSTRGVRGMSASVALPLPRCCLSRVVDVAV